MKNRSVVCKDFSTLNNVEILSNFSNVSMEDEWYRIAVESHFWLNWRLTAMLKQLNQIKIPINKELKALEVGCGMGVLRAGLESNTKWNIDAADLNMHALLHAGSGRGRTIFYDVFDEIDSLIESYDIVILYDVLEHIDDTKLFLVSVLRHLKPGGILLLNVPALRSFYSAYDEIMGHCRRYNKKTLVDEFSGLRLKILDVRYWGVSMLPLLALRTIVMLFIEKEKRKIVKKGFKPSNSTLNMILHMIMRFETLIFNKPPIGTSLLLAGEKY